LEKMLTEAAGTGWQCMPAWTGSGGTIHARGTLARGHVGAIFTLNLLLRWTSQIR
jgi:hypothetical protein